MEGDLGEADGLGVGKYRRELKMSPVVFHSDLIAVAAFRVTVPSVDGTSLTEKAALSNIHYFANNSVAINFFLSIFIFYF